MLSIRRILSLTPALHRFYLKPSDETVESGFIDYLEVTAIGGRGGNGLTATIDIGRNRKKPTGGSGGSGGDVLFMSSRKHRDFSHISSTISGQNGLQGRPKNRRGVRGDQTVIHVPVGTVVGCQISQKPLVELSTEGEVFCGAQGGAGGKGNSAMSMAESHGSDRGRCREVEEGQDGETNELYLEMKMIADIGLVGLPNAGKSSLLNAITFAKPKVAAYPFTTMRPHVGAVHFTGHYQVTMADIPGLIEGSSLGLGLGHSFLKHIERSQSLLYVVDAANEEYLAVETISILQKELHAFNPELVDRVIGIVANKIDLLNGPERVLELAKAYPQYSVIPISAMHSRNISSVRSLIEPYKTRNPEDEPENDQT